VTVDHGLPAHMIDFIRQHIHSIEGLEVLLLLRASSPGAWTIELLAHELKVSESAIVSAAEKLVESRMVARLGGDSHSRYVYRAPDELAAGIAQLEQLYATDRFEVIQAVGSGAISRVRRDVRRAFPGVFWPPDGKKGQ
jgi:predicted transcriptional regulator